MTHKLVKVLRTPEDTLEDSATELTGTAEIAIGNAAQPFPVKSYAENTSTDCYMNMTAATFKSMVLLSTVNCVITFTGVTVIDGITATTVTLTANVIRQVLSFTGTLTKIAVGPNTTNGGAAGMIQIRVLYEVGVA